MSQPSSIDIGALQSITDLSQIPSEAQAAIRLSGLTIEDIPEKVRPVWSMVFDIIRSGNTVDSAVVASMLERTNRQDLIPYCVETVGFPMCASSALVRCVEVRKNAVRERAIDAARSALRQLESGVDLPTAAITLAQANDIAGSATTGSRVRNCRGSAVSHIEHLEARWADTAPKPLITGWPDFDDDIGLINNLIVIGSRAGVGKSAVVAGLVRQWLSSGVKVGILSYEDDTRNLIARLVAQRSGSDLRTASGDRPGTEHERLEIASALEWWNNVEGLLESDDERPPGTIEDAVASVREMVKRGCKVVILDNLTCLRFGGSSERFDLEVSRALLDLRSEAQAGNIPVIVVGHIKRGQTEAEESERPPRMSDFKDSSGWENFARVMLGCWRDENRLMMRILKQTNGPSGIDFELEVATRAAVVVGCTRAVKPTGRTPGTGRDER